MVINGRMLVKMAIVAGIMFFLIWVGCKAGNAIDAESKQSEIRMGEAMKVLQDG